MKVNYQNNQNISFNGVLNNKILKKGLEFAADNGTLFAATTTLVLSGIRPFAILTTPKTDKKNKQVASAKSITSSINGYLISLLFSIPLSRSIQKINRNPGRYLKPETINSLKEANKPLTESKAYTMATQIFKLGLGFVIAAPKSILTAIGTPYVLNCFNNNDFDNKTNTQKKQDANVNFKGKGRYPRKIGEIINGKKFQEFVKKHADSNFVLHIIAATDTLSTLAFVHQTALSKKFEEKDKKPLIFNSIFSTALSIASTYLIDKLTKNKTDKFIKRFEEANKNDPKLKKYVEGIKVAKPILIVGSIYYILIPIISTFLADRIKNKETKD